MAASSGVADLPTLLVGFRSMVLSIIIGLILGLLSILCLVIIHYSEKTVRLLTMTSVVVAIIFGVCMFKLPRAYIFSLLSIFMLMAAGWLGFVGQVPPIFKVASGFLALGAGLLKIYFY